jgi:hypothetical protein
MKLLYCPECLDMKKLRMLALRRCTCGKARGYDLQMTSRPGTAAQPYRSPSRTTSCARPVGSDRMKGEAQASERGCYPFVTTRSESESSPTPRSR